MDLYSEIKQSASDKLVGSVTYPFQVFEKREEFPGCSSVAMEGMDLCYTYSKEEIKALLKASTEHVRKRSGTGPQVTVESEVYSFAGEVVERAKAIIEAANSAGKDYEGPDVNDLRNIVEHGIEGLVDTLGDFEMYAWNSYLSVTVKTKPTIILNSPRIDLDGIEMEVKATGELWSKFPWWNCYRWCTKWEKIFKCKRIASFSISPTIKAKCHANMEALGSRVNIRAEFDELRLDYPILRDIPLQAIANSALKNKLLEVFDASKLIATVPVLESRFSIKEILLPATSGGLAIGILLQQL